MQIRPLSFDHTQEERTANARLIAAAPDLLEALSSLLDAVTDIRGIEMGDYCQAELASAEAAIAKATQP